jgi:Leucine-rich repeat (LRR) protein
LEGAEFCIHTKNMDLSDNMISDLNPLFELSLLEELNLSDNRIECIDVLSNLINLKILNLADNDIKDITPLFELRKLESVNLTGNKINTKQLKDLIESGVTVDF